mmetsp:Transcript_59825/g.129624  ORF Transcript_59825/g.129624 Transcript_59825/m.129624 type:complete len:316 (-) Transcript_59825:258-1205(-)
MASMLQSETPLMSMSPSESCSDDSTSALNEMIQQCIRSGSPHQAEMLLNNMESLGVSPNVVSFNLVLNTYSNNGDMQKAGMLLRSMLQQDIQPNDVTYATLCKVMAFHGQVAEIQKFLELLQKRNVKLNVFFYGSLISACGRCTPPDVLTAERTFNELVQAGLRPQSVKRCLARAVGLSRASALISRACYHSAGSIERVPTEAPRTRTNQEQWADATSPAWISPSACMPSAAVESCSKSSKPPLYSADRACLNTPVHLNSWESAFCTTHQLHIDSVKTVRSNPARVGGRDHYFNPSPTTLPYSFGATPEILRLSV